MELLPYTTHDVRLAILVCFLVVSAVTDICRGKVYNWCTLSAALAGIIIGGIEGGLSGIGFYFASWLLGIGLLFLPFAVGGIGAGDVKMLGGVGALMGPVFVVETLLWGAICGGIMALMWMLCRGALSEQLRKVLIMAHTRTLLDEDFRNRKSGDNLPYALAIAMGAALAGLI